MYASLAIARASAGATLVWALADQKRRTGRTATPEAKLLRVMAFMA
jgi:hypothetical protein